MNILVLADTHLTAERRELLIDAIGPQLERADRIVHAGDITSSEVIDLLETFAPVYAVSGNNDVGLALPEVVQTVIGGVSFAIVHDSGPSRDRTRRLAATFPDAQVIVFGHSHLPWHETTEIAGRVQHHFNPGSPTQRRRAPDRTVGWVEIGADRTVHCRHEIIPAP